VIAAVIFDLDGVILDSETPEVRAWEETYARYGLRFPRASWLLNVGRNDGPWDPLAPFRGAESPAAPDAVVGAWRTRVDALLPEYLAPLPGVVPLLRALRARGVRTAVASSSRRGWIARVLAQLDLQGQFDAAAGGDEVPRAKPAPDVYRLAAQRLGVPPAACVALEDSPAGVQAARAAGMRCIAVPSPVTSGLDFSAADLVVPSLEHVTPEAIAALPAAAPPPRAAEGSGGERHRAEA
jgi:HAD superfamily hydrolase (TIGR01509 family)